MLNFKNFIIESATSPFESEDDVSNEQHNQNYIEGLSDYNSIIDPKFKPMVNISEVITPTEGNDKRVDVRGPSNSSGVTGVEVPKHMLHGSNGLLEVHKRAQEMHPIIPPFLTLGPVLE